MNLGSGERRGGNQYQQPYQAYQGGITVRPKPPPRKCPICGVEFTPGRYQLNQVFCSRECVKKMHSNREIRSIAEYKKRVGTGN